MKKLLPLLIIASFLAWLPTTDAQLTISGEDVIVCDYGTVSVDITASNFIDITSAQFGVTWDTDVVSFTGVTNNMPASVLYNTSYAANGELIFAWFDSGPPPLGYSLPGPPVGSGVLFTINFDIVGNYNPDDFSIVNIGNSPHYTMEIASTSGVIPNGSITINPGSVAIDDPVPPVVTCPSSIIVTAPIGQNSAVVSYAAPTVTDNCDVPPPPGTCSPVSGSTFPVGTTTVTCTATDDSNNTSNCTFTVTVNPPPPNPNALTFTADDIALNCNVTSVNIPIRVKNFDNMVSSQFALVWDETVLDYDGYTDSINADGHPSAIYNANNANIGEFRFSWLDANGPAGENLPDSSVIFVMHFTLLDDTDLPDTVAFDELPGFVIEFANTGGVITPPNYVLNDAVVSLVPDTIPPVITCPANQTLSANASCQATLGNYIGLATATDNCTATPAIVIAQQPAPGTIISSTTLVLLIAADEAGNKDTCSFNAIFVDDTFPSITCPAAVAAFTNSNNCVATGVALGTPATSDNCGVNPATNNAPASFPLGSTTVTWTVTDVNGNPSTCQQTVTVTDNVNPTITCPPAVSVGTGAGACQATNVSLGTPTTADNCGVNPATNNAPATFPIGATSVTWTVTDVNGNSKTCAQTVTVTDDENPSITCPADQTIYADNNCEATLPSYTSMAIATDNCTAALSIVITQTPAAGTVITDTTEVRLIAQDAAGLKDTCFFDVNLVDSLLPTITCPANDTLDVDSSECFATLLLPAATASDNCGIFSVTDNGPANDEFPVGTTTVTFTATDVNGNVATCFTTVVVNDTIAPVITCPANILQGTDAGDCTAMVTWAAPAVVDNCPNVTVTCTPLSGTSFPLGNSTIVCIAEDANGLLDTCKFVVTVFDDEAPALQCPADTMILVPAGTVDTVINDIYLFFIGDNCGLDTTYYHFAGAIPSGGDDGSDASGTAFPVGITTVTYFGEDDAGNIDSCSFEVTIIEDVPLSVTCSAGQSLGNDAGDCGAAVTGVTATAAPVISLQSAFYEISGATISNGTGLDASGNYNVGISMVTFYAVSIVGDTVDCSLTIEVSDDEAPTLQCGADTTIIVPAGTVDTVINDIYLFFLGDNCGVGSNYYEFTGAIPNGGGPGSDASGTPFPVGTTTVTYFAEDAAGNIDSCSFDVIIVEGIILTLTCPPNQTVANAAGNCGALVNGLTADVSPLGAAVNSYYQITGATIGNGSGLNASGGYNVGVSTVTFFAIGNGGDTYSCSTIVTVNDTQSPVFTNCPAGPITMGNTTDECGLRFNGAIVPVATDNCPGVTLSYNFAVGSLIPLGTNTVTAIATDASNNVTPCTYTLVVTDTQPPKFLNCQNGSTITKNNDLGQCGAVVDWVPLVTAQDNCVLLALSETSPGNGDFFPVGNTTVTYTAVDDKGNVATCEINVTIIDNQSPALTCPGNQPPVNTALNQCSAAVNFPMPTATDNCGVINFGPITPVGPVFDEGVHTLTYEASDAAGNVTPCSFTVTVVDNQFPFIPFMPADLTVFTAPGDCGAIVNWSPPGYPTDNCGIESFGPSGGAPGDFFGVGTHVVKYVAMDINGNITVEALNITVQDDTPPVINCPTGMSISVDGFSIDDPDGLLTGAQPLDCDNIELDLAALTATDACGIFSFAQTAGLPSGSPFPIGATTMSFEATDNYGNSSTCSFVINVLDFQLTPATVSQGLVCEGDNVTFSVGTLPGATYTWTTGGDVVSTQPIFVLTNAALNQSGIYTAVVSTGYCDIEFTTELNVSAVPVVTIDANDIFCATNNLPLTLTGNNSSTANVTSWAWTFPDSSVHAGQTQTVQNPDITDSGIYCVTATSAFGCATTECEQIDVLTGPTTPVVNGTTANTCLGTEFTLFGQLYSGNNVTYHWSSIPAVGSGLQSINNPIVGVEPTVAGNYTYFFYVTVDGCDSDVAEWAVTVEAAPTIVLDTLGETQCVDGNSNLTLVDNGSGATSWMWMGPFGSLPGNTSSVVLQNVTPSFSGVYTVVAKTDIGCSSTATATLTFTSAPSPAAQLTVSDDTICEGSNYFTFTGTQYNGVVDYIWTGDNVPPNSQGQNQIDVFPSGPGSYDYGFAAFVNGCYSDTVTVTVTVTPAPVLDIDVVGDLDCVDGTSSITLSTAATGLSTIEWTDGNGIPLSNANPLVLSNVDSTDSGPIYIAGTNLQGCTGYGDTFLNITDGIDGLTATSTMMDCELGVLSLEASTITNASYTWFKPNDQIFAITQNANLANATDGVYTVVAQVGGCADTATVDVDLPNVLDANDKLVECLVNVPQEFNILAYDIYEAGQPFTINILQQGTNGTVTYVDNDSIYLYTPNPGFWGTDFMIYEICYTDCPSLCSIAKVTFDVSPDPGKCVITTVISPNEDGYNDEFVVSCVDGNPSNTLYIFNQWGDKVYDAAPYENDWKGTHDGRDLPDGTYFFIFQQGPDTPAKKGFVLIYR